MESMERGVHGMAEMSEHGDGSPTGAKEMQKIAVDKLKLNPVGNGKPFKMSELGGN